MSKPTDDRITPQDFFDELDREFHFDIDVAASKENAKVPDCFITEQQNALSVSWGDMYDLCPCQPMESVMAWMNPPYSNITPWVEKVYEERLNGVTTVALLPASTSSHWFHRRVWDASMHRTYPYVEIRFPKKRLVFGPHFTGAKWPSMVVIFRSL